MDFSLSRWKHIGIEVHNQIAWYKFKRMSGWTYWLRITMPIFTSNDAMMLFEVLWKMDCRCTLEINWKAENSELDWEALNWMNEFISGGLRLNIFPLDERLKKKLFFLWGKRKWQFLPTLLYDLRFVCVMYIMKVEKLSGTHWAKLYQYKHCLSWDMLPM